MKKTKEIQTALNTMAIKARVANLIRTTLFEYGTTDWEIKYRNKKRLTEEDKIRIFDMISSANAEMHNALNSYKQNRKFKAKVEKLRLEKSQKGLEQ
jgi:hypothetical protein